MTSILANAKVSLTSIHHHHRCSHHHDHLDLDNTITVVVIIIIMIMSTWRTPVPSQSATKASPMQETPKPRARTWYLRFSLKFSWRPHVFFLPYLQDKRTVGVLNWNTRPKIKMMTQFQDFWTYFYSWSVRIWEIFEGHDPPYVVLQSHCSQGVDGRRD